MGPGDDDEGGPSMIGISCMSTNYCVTGYVLQTVRTTNSNFAISTHDFFLGGPDLNGPRGHDIHDKLLKRDILCVHKRMLAFQSVLPGQSEQHSWRADCYPTRHLAS